MLLPHIIHTDLNVHFLKLFCENLFTDSYYLIY